MLNLKCADCGEKVYTHFGQPIEHECSLCARCSMPFGPDEIPIETMGGPLHSSCAATAAVGDDTRPSLSLLIVDFGEACIVRVEKNANGVAPLAQEVCSRNEGSLSWVDAPFAGVRAELDHRPVPRIERVAEDKRESDLHRYNFVQTNDKIRRLSSAAYDDLAAIFGKPAQVYEDAGTWTRLPSTAEYMGDPLEGLGIAIWRYTQEGKNE